MAGGIEPKIVQAGLGNESMNTILNIYADEVAENDNKATEYMVQLFGIFNTIFCIALFDVRYRSCWSICIGGIPSIRNRYEDIFVCQNVL